MSNAMSKSDNETQRLCQIAVCDERFERIAEQLQTIKATVEKIDAKVSNGLTSNLVSLRTQTMFQWWLLGGIIAGFGAILLALALKVAHLS